MSTRGICGFRLGDQDLLAYNYSDSYPSCLGVKIADFVCSHQDLDELRRKVSNLRLVNTHEKPTREDIAACKAAGVVDLSASQRDHNDWYYLLRNCQGDLAKYLKLGLIPNAQDFIKDSLFCEWAYIVNLDTNVLEVWEGSQESPQSGNRYGETINKEGYYPCRLTTVISFKEVAPSLFSEDNSEVWRDSETLTFNDAYAYGKGL